MGDGEYVINADPFTKTCSKCDTMPKYDKLIRDKIPQIIESEGKRCGVEVMEYTEFAKYPKKKLQEEVDDFMESDEIDDLVDVYEVILGMLELKGVEIEEFERRRRGKAEERGRFEGRLKLSEVTGNKP